MYFTSLSLSPGTNGPQRGEAELEGGHGDETEGSPELQLSSDCSQISAPVISACAAALSFKSVLKFLCLTFHIRRGITVARSHGGQKCAVMPGREGLTLCVEGGRRTEMGPKCLQGLHLNGTPKCLKAAGAGLQTNDIKRAAINRFAEEEEEEGGQEGFEVAAAAAGGAHFL
ncbi:hypothetical protein EYF80_000436 [Liparis tanakae]|uniref:Uncharacterized protein n=1 Tax=Liparis tanakae TaxID=230148 RepID=A0A4Z2JHN3_9TELE|nr:hypothetical protein EYF80_000436 [Liparis tanakae]